MKCTCHEKSVVEIKCPHKIWDETIKENFKDLDFLTLNTNANISMNKKHKYYTQINSQMVLAKSDQNYFVVSTTKSIFVQKIDRDLIHWSKVSIKLEVFSESYAVKALHFVANVVRSRWKRMKLLKMNTISRVFVVTDVAYGIISSVGILIQR